MYYLEFFMVSLFFSVNKCLYVFLMGNACINVLKSTSSIQSGTPLSCCKESRLSNTSIR